MNSVCAAALQLCDLVGAVANLAQNVAGVLA